MIARKYARRVAKAQAILKAHGHTGNVSVPLEYLHQVLPLRLYIALRLSRALRPTRAKGVFTLQVS